MSKDFALGIDIGGSHLAIAIVNIEEKEIIKNTKVHVPINSKQDALTILTTLTNSIKTCIQKFNEPIQGIGISIPGPFDYENGISKIYNCNKYESLLGIDIKTYLYNNLGEYISAPSKIVFVNDASGFLLGEVWKHSLNGSNVTAITLGTGIGSSFMKNGSIISEGSDVPQNGYVYNLPLKGKRAEDWLGVDWFLNTYKEATGEPIKNVKTIANKVPASKEAKKVFESFGTNLGEFLFPLLNNFNAQHLILGGNITKSYELFKTQFEDCFQGELPSIHIAESTEDAAILGAVYKLINENNIVLEDRRITKQFLMPIRKQPEEETKDGYNVFPSFELNNGKINQGFKSLAKEIAGLKSIVIDGYIGVYWDEFMFNLTKELNAIGVNPITYSTTAAFKDSKNIDQMIAPNLGGDDPVFGKVFTGELIDFFDIDKFNKIESDQHTLSILYGPGAALSKWDSKIIYVDIPKNEIQYRSRSGALLNLGASAAIPPKEQYKRMFFVDWIALNKHKAQLLKNIDYIVDGQYFNDISWSNGHTLREGLDDMSNNVFRARPWFEAGVWGGQWLKNKIDGLALDVVNYAWSFELIVPENGIVFSNSGVRLEVSFDLLMYNDNEAILGDAAQTFGYDFPIRFDYLDTFDGENLSLQCHPTPEYIKENFGEKFTQDETYYILDAETNAEVYLGFKKGVNKDEFHQALVESQEQGKAMDTDRFIQRHPAKKHDLFLIPNGTIHCSGKDSLVLEISSTPYIYTFKMYDWMRLDLDGNPRPLNVKRGMDVVNFDCQTASVKDEYISKENIIAFGDTWKTIYLSTHPKHFYEVFRFEFNNEMEIETNNQCHILNLVEGSKIKVITGDRSMVIQFAETFVIPSNVKTYSLINLGDTEAKVIQSNVKPNFCNTRL